MIHFFAEGRPVPQGSKVARVLVRGGQIIYRNGYPVIIQHDQSGRRLKEWRKTVWVAARKAWTGGLLSGPICLDLEFRMPRPMAHFDSRGRLRLSAPQFHTNKPDRTKLARAVEDALTEVIWADDSQVIAGGATKLYAEPGGPIGVDVRISLAAEPAYKPAEQPALFR